MGFLVMSFVYCAVLGRGNLSPLLFNIYVDELINILESSGHGICVGQQFLGCILYADDILLMSASVVSLQKMVDICFCYGQEFDIVFNAKKSVSVVFGKDCKYTIENLMLGEGEIPWVQSFKNLGIIFIYGSRMCINYNYIKRKFYTACNSILTFCKHDDEMVKLHLVKSYCLPLLSYCIGALYIANRDVQLLGVCWNDAYRKIFGYNLWESVRDLPIACGQESFDGL